MTALNLYHDLTVQGFSLSLSGDKLTLSPANKLTDELRAQIRKHKPDLIKLLAANDTNDNLKPFLTKIELTDLRTDLSLQAHEKAFSKHLLDCPYCHMVKGQYCASGAALGRVYDDLLLTYDDAQARREDYQLRIDKACIARRKNH